MLYVKKLKCAGMENPLGISIQSPQFSWNLFSDRRNTKQIKYRLLICDSKAELLKDQPKAFYDSGIVASDESQLYIPRLFAKSAKRYYWKVFVWDNHGQSAQSEEEAWFEFGLMSSHDWQARWIEPPQHPVVSNLNSLFERISGTLTVKERNDKEPLVNENITFPCPMIRKQFTVESKVNSARIYATAHGIYTLQLNGHRVGNYEFAPECTNYMEYLQVQTYDITDLLQEGKNVVGVILANGWWGSQIGLNGTSAQYGDKLALLMQIQIKYEDGSEEIIGTDESFSSAEGPLRYSELFLGEKYDLNFSMKGWTSPEFDASAWVPSTVCDFGYKNLVGQNAEHIQVLKRMQDVKIYDSPKGELMIDFKQVLAGNASMHIKADPHATITLSYTQETDKEGNYWFAAIGANNGHEDVFVLDETGEGEYDPMFTYTGFRYIRVTSDKGNVELSGIEARLIGSKLRETARVNCSNPLVNKLQENIRWTLLSNIPSILTDNPDRERAGWTGDCQMVAPTVCYNLGAKAFFTRWLKEMMLEQDLSGGIPLIIPNWQDYSIMEKYLFRSPAGWGDVSTILPWLLYERYGDVKVLEESYSMMKKWVAYETNLAESSNPTDIGNISEARAQRQKYLWNTGYQFGDWMVPSAVYNKKTDEYAGATQCLTHIVGTYYYAASVNIVAKTAKILNEESDVVYYENLLTKIQDAAIAEIYDTGDILESEYMGAQIFALHMNLYPKEDKDKVLGRLVELIKEKGFDAGFNSACLVWQILSENNLADLAYDFLLNEDFPSWLYGVKQGATSVWEQMQAILPNGDRRPMSFIQPAFCSVGDWMVSGMVGIQPAKPGFKEILFKPNITNRLEFAEGTYESIHGEISCSWAWEEESILMKVSVPANVVAKVILPGAMLKQTFEQGKPLSENNGIGQATQQKDTVVVHIGSGEYNFTYPFVTSLN